MYMNTSKQDIQAFIDKVYNKVKPNKRGHVATYIPQLAKADPNLFGISFVTCDGTVYKAGQSSKTVIWAVHCHLTVLSVLF
jgi:glutaminase